MNRQMQFPGSLRGRFQQRKGSNGGIGTGQMVLGGIVGIVAGSLSQNNVPQMDVIGNAAGSADAENWKQGLFYIFLNFPT